MAVSPPTVQRLLEKLHSVSSWYMLGIHMEVEPSQLDKIRIQFLSEGVERCKAELFKHWTISCPQASWTIVASALEKIGEVALSETVRKECSSAPGPALHQPQETSSDIEAEPIIVDRLVVKKFTKLESKFARLVANAKKSLEESRIPLKQVERFITERLEYKVPSSLDLDELFHSIRPFYCFLQYSLLEDIIDEFIGDLLQADLEQYEADLEQFKSSTKIREVANTITSLLKSAEGAQPVVIKLAGCWMDITLRHFLSFMKQVFLKRARQLVNISVTDGCVCISWLAPQSAIPSLTGLAQVKLEFLEAVGVLELRMGSATLLKKEELPYPGDYLLNAARKCDAKALELLLSLKLWPGCSPHAYQDLLFDALLISCRHGCRQVAELLLQSGANCNHLSQKGLALGQDGPTPLMIAALTGNLDLTQLILSYGADVNTTTSQYTATPLTLAAMNSHSDVVNLLQSQTGVNLNHQDKSGYTALMFASLRQNAEIVLQLLESGADPSIQDTTGSNALMHACRIPEAPPDPIIPKILLSTGVDANHADKEGRTALCIASATNHQPAVESLLGAQASVNKCDRHQKNALCYAAEAGNVAITERLLNAGSGFLGMAHDLASANKHTEVCLLLQARMPQPPAIHGQFPGQGSQ